MSRKSSLAYQRLEPAIRSLSEAASSSTPVSRTLPLQQHAELVLARVQSSQAVPDWKLHEFARLLLQESPDDWRAIARALCDMFTYVVASRSVNSAYATGVKAGREAAKSRNENRRRKKTDCRGALEDEEKRRGVRLNLQTSKSKSVVDVWAARIGFSSRQIRRVLKKRDEEERMRSRVTSR